MKEGKVPTADEMGALLRLLDDETPEVRRQVEARLALCGGDLSEWLAMHDWKLGEREKSVLSVVLRPGRREALEREWVVPIGGASALREDWDGLEAMLRWVSDFLHDGVTLRQPLSDGLDLLAEEAFRARVRTANELRAFLFEAGRLEGNRNSYDDPRNSDLAWSISEGKSNPLGLCVIFILVGRRMEFQVEGINFPAHFLCRIIEDDETFVVDCFDRGRLHLHSELMIHPKFGPTERVVLQQTAHPGEILLRLLNNLEAALRIAGRSEDAALIRRLRETLV